MFYYPFTPTSENRMGPSALNYYLMRNRDMDVQISIFSFNVNRISSDEISKIERNLMLKFILCHCPNGID